MPKSFVHDDLDDPGRQIRLLRLLPDSNLSSKVRCVLEVADFDCSPEYDGLSYTWGDERLTEPIIVNECESQATNNLKCALRHLRSKQSRILWVDAVCINQKNVDERNHQVKRVGKIYAKASKVIVWLGEADENTALAFSTLEPLASLSDILVTAATGRNGGNPPNAFLV